MCSIHSSSAQHQTAPIILHLDLRPPLQQTQRCKTILSFHFVWMQVPHTCSKPASASKTRPEQLNSLLRSNFRRRRMRTISSTLLAPTKTNPILQSIRHTKTHCLGYQEWEFVVGQGPLSIKRQKDNAFTVSQSRLRSLVPRTHCLGKPERSV